MPVMEKKILNRLYRDPVEVNGAGNGAPGLSGGGSVARETIS